MAVFRVPEGQGLVTFRSQVALIKSNLRNVVLLLPIYKYIYKLYYKTNTG